MLGENNDNLLTWVKASVGVVTSALAGVIVYLHKAAKTQMAQELDETKRERDEARQQRDEIVEERNRLLVENAMLKARHGEDSA